MQYVGKTFKLFYPKPNSQFVGYVKVLSQKNQCIFVEHLNKDGESIEFKTTYYLDDGIQLVEWTPEKEEPDNAERNDADHEFQPLVETPHGTLGVITFFEEDYPGIWICLKQPDGQIHDLLKVEEDVSKKQIQALIYKPEDPDGDPDIAQLLKFS